MCHKRVGEQDWVGREAVGQDRESQETLARGSGQEGTHILRDNPKPDTSTNIHIYSSHPPKRDVILVSPFYR